MKIIDWLKSHLVPEWKSFFHQSSTQLALLSIAAQAIDWIQPHISLLSDTLPSGLFQVVSIVSAALVPIARNWVQKRVTEERDRATESA